MTGPFTIIVADDDAAIRTVVRRALTRDGYLVRTTESAAGLWRLIDEDVGDVVITDVMFPDGNGLDALPRIIERRPGLKVIVMSAQNTLSTAVRATEQGAFDYLPKPFDLDELTRAVASALAVAGVMGEETLGEDMPLIGRSAAMQEVYRTIARVVPTSLTVMILGESGTGKELVARAIHDLGPRRREPFVAVNMAAIPRELIESELFGHERGAFTGAAARASGRFEQAQGGTLFLDEIGDMPIDAQTRLLRVLQSGDFTAVGSARVQRADVRIVAATNQDLRRLIEAGRFREDLFYRLNVIPLKLPPLRARIDDIPVLARHFLDRAAAEGLPRKGLDAGAIEAIQRHSWPGNVRELENLMRRLAALTRGDTIGEATISEGLDGETPPVVVVPDSTGSDGLAASVELHLARYLTMFGEELPPDGLYDRVLAEIERPLLRLSLAATGGNQIRAARLLGINRNTLRKKLTERGVDPGARGG
ncbi:MULTISPECIES: nitrogen regulation protein NR(I) [Sphingosinicellaceae]|uniref:nitrogen regulation protein NR(I) n=1 Tax=Sphingosinicellaceae TaxID=2820280 RepID=UPI001C1E326F|nr:MULTISPECIES: nitrogen regulation protein NR(I) [Polymorphobacter]QYE34216.1 nitrogen regulation protein NR(I) [Polymorphobacter sp. PAMC 29334]UAJ09395.1 nitrogen regulation protein NR(I) [Polymorphobacter megasporae]